MEQQEDRLELGTTVIDLMDVSRIIENSDTGVIVLEFKGDAANKIRAFIKKHTAIVATEPQHPFLSGVSCV